MTISILTQTRDFSIQQNLIPHNWQDYADIPFVIPAMLFFASKKCRELQEKIHRSFLRC